MTDTYSDASAQIIEAIDRLPPLRQLVSQADLTAKKSLGQNFLFDLNLTRRIARTAAPFSGPVLEIGPGQVALHGHYCSKVPHSLSQWKKTGG